MDEIEWRPVALEPYGQHYAVSNHGDVIRLTGGYRNAKAGRLLTQKLTQDGYLAVNLCVNGQARCFTIHSLVLVTFVGQRPDGYVARHLNGTRTDNRSSNLAWGTIQDNVDDRGRHGRHPRGMRCAKAKLTNEKVIAIRQAHAAKTPVAEIVQAYGVSRGTIEKVIYRTTWRHI